MPASPTRALDVFDVSVLGAGSHLWVSANSSQGSVYGVPRARPTWALDGPTVPADWLSTAVRHAQREAGQAALDVGRQLRDLVFGVPDIAALFQQARGAAGSAGRQVLLRVLVAPEEVSAWPWELIIDPQRPDQYLTLARDVHIVRAGRSRTYPVRAEPVEPPLNLLMVMSSPLSYGSADEETPFDLYEEKRSLLTELRPLEERGLLRVEIEDRPTVEGLRARIGRQRRGFHLLHYLGHAQPAGLKLEMSRGRGRLVTGQDFAALLQQMPDLRLAVFAGCETARAPRDPEMEEWPGPLSVADYCVRDACPMVIGMQAVLPFGTERLFTRFFYQALTAGQPVAEALRLARLAIADDQHSGRPLVNWAVPALFVGGSLPGPVTDPTSKAEPQPRRSRIALRLGVRQRDLRFISRLTQLRESIDVLSGRSPARLLHVIGLPGTGKSSFLDRATEELDDDVVILSMTASRLLGKEEPLEELSRLVADLIRRAGRKPTARGALPSVEWWERLMEDLTDFPMALVLDDADELVAAGAAGESVLQALSLLTLRRSRVRIAVAAETEIASLTKPLEAEEIRRIALKPLAWPEVWQWIRRNLPVLTRFPETALASFYSDLSHLEQWEQLADAVSDMANPVLGDLPDIVAEIAAKLRASATSPARPPVFGGEKTRVGPELIRPADTGAAARRALKVAVAGPHTAGREAAFSRAVTRFAAEHWVSGRVVAPDSGDSSSSVGELLSLPSPFDERGSASTQALADWIAAAGKAGADIVVLDFGGPSADPGIGAAVETLLDAGCLVIAAGGNSGAPTYPAWIEMVLAVGALDDNGQPAAYSPYFSKDRKPDLYAPKRLDSGPVSSIVEDPGLQGTSMAALNATAAAIVVWASDPGLSGPEVRRLLVNTARQLGPSGRVLDVDAALAATRRKLLLDTLQNESLEIQQILAETGLRPEVAMPLIDDLIESNTVTPVRIGDVETLEYRSGLPQ
jgi:CHAT domain/Subtilase family